jgi:hypothetical protein
MRHTILVLTVALVAGTSQARADMLTYNMTGRITSGGGVLNGDLISWTLQYDRSTPASTTTRLGSYYQLNGATITNLVDQTTGYHFFPASTPVTRSFPDERHLGA